MDEVLEVKLDAIHTMLAEMRADLKEVKSEQQRMRINMVQTDERLQKGAETFVDIRNELIQKKNLIECAMSHKAQEADLLALRESVKEKIDSKVLKAYLIGAAFGGGLGGGALGAVLVKFFSGVHKVL